MTYLRKLGNDLALEIVIVPGLSHLIYLTGDHEHRASEAEHLTLHECKLIGGRERPVDVTLSSQRGDDGRTRFQRVFDHLFDPLLKRH